MNIFASLLALFSGVTFVAYGTLCVFTRSLDAEFERYGFAAHQKSIGLLELCGGLGLLAGLYYPPLLAAAALGLTALMIGAVFVRFRLRDPFILCAPAILLLGINLFLFLHYF